MIQSVFCYNQIPPICTTSGTMRRKRKRIWKIITNATNNDSSNIWSTSVANGTWISSYQVRTRLKVCCLMVMVILTHPRSISVTATQSPTVLSSINQNMEEQNQQQYQHQSNPARQLTPEEFQEDQLFLAWVRSLQGNDISTTLLPENSTNTPTIELTTPLETEFPTETPTITPSPTHIESVSPTGLESTMPSALPSATYSPSFLPTRTVSPSFAPSHSLQPTVSTKPSSQPSPIPLMEPSISASGTPATVSTMSSQPTITPQPTTTIPPTMSLQPSRASLAPTLSLLPSTVPSQIPSLEPTVSSQPSFSPSISKVPTISSIPSSIPSALPTGIPSNSPTQPSEFPSLRPTIVLEGEPFLANKVYMVLDGLSQELGDEEEIDIWQNVTSEHILNFWSMVTLDRPEDVPVFVSSVVTTLTSQTWTEMKEKSLFGNDDSHTMLQISYTQEFVYGLFGDTILEPEILQDYLVLLPFRTDSYEYSTALTEALNLTNLVWMTEMDAGDPPAPTMPPAPVGSTIPQRAVRAISASFVVGACLIVAFLLWDRNRKDSGRFPADTESEFDDSQHGRRRCLDTLEFDNAGQPVDWTNPYSDQAASVVAAAAAAVAVARGGTGGGDTTSGGGMTGGNRSGGTSASSRDGSQSGDLLPLAPPARTASIRSVPSVTNSPILNTVESSGPPLPFPMAHRVFPLSRPPSQRTTSTASLPPLAPGVTTLNSNGVFNGGSGRSSSARSPLMFGSTSGINWRHTSMTDTEITDLTYSDVQSDGDESDVANLTHLPPISDESLKDHEMREHFASTFFSPLHIPDEEAIDLAAALSPPSSPIPSTTDIISDIATPVMTGFDMQIQELE